MALHVNIEDLLSSKTVESDRIEYKEGWNPDAIYRSICAFANDFDNSGGGNILIGVAEDIAEVIKSADYQSHEIISTIDNDIVRDIVGGVAGGITDREVKILDLCRIPQYRDELFKQLQLAKHPTNYKLYVKPFVDMNWLKMTIPNKPTSPNQQYLTTLKGRLILEFLKHKTQ